MATSTHRKIDLQSTGDLAYLHRNMQAAARQKLDLHFPPEAALSDGGLEGGGGDSLRGRVEGEVLMVCVDLSFWTLWFCWWGVGGWGCRGGGVVVVGEGDGAATFAGGGSGKGEDSGRPGESASIATKDRAQPTNTGKRLLTTDPMGGRRSSSSPKPSRTQSRT